MRSKKVLLNKEPNFEIFDGLMNQREEMRTGQLLDEPGVLNGDIFWKDRWGKSESRNI